LFLRLWRGEVILMAGANVIVLTKENFGAETSKGVVLVDFWAPWCGPCRMISPVVDALAEEMKGKARFGKVNIDEQPELSEKFEVASIPTVLLFKDGKMIANRVGAANKDALKEWISASLKG
jgi:thioredoxin 1